MDVIGEPVEQCTSELPGELPLQAKQPLLVPRLQQFMDESRGGGEANRQPLLAGRETEPETDVGLAGAGVTDRGTASASSS